MRIDNVEWVDEDDTILGIIPRAKAHKEGLLHRIAVIYLTRDNGDILVQERISGRFDHSSAGHVDPGEDYLTAAKRELCEELGVCNVELKEIGASIADEVEPEAGRNRIRHKYKLYEYHGEPGKLQEDEVKSVFWSNPLDIYQAMQDDPNNEKYCGGFKDSLKCFLKVKRLV